MNKLYNCVELAVNNSDCVVLKVKKGKEFDLISLGCFDGDETMFRLTKGDKHTCTVWRDGSNPFSWEWGIGGHTLVSDKTNKVGKMIQDCIENDFRIFMGKRR